MSYVIEALTPGEKIVARARFHWIAWVKTWGELIVLGVFLIGIVWFVRDLAKMLTSETAVTNRRLIFKSGWLDRHVMDLELNSIEAANIDQGFWGRLFGYGRVSVHGTGDDVWRTPIIAKPIAFRRAIETALLEVSGPARAR